MQIRQQLAPEYRWEVLCPNYMNPTEITFHNTYNDASAQNERDNVVNNSTGTSFHIAVDDKEAIQLLPFNRNAWHAGDGENGRGNRHSIGVEICYSKSGGPRYEKAVQNAIIVIKQLMAQFNIPIDKVKTHQERNGKYCPHRMLAEGRVGWFKQQLVSGEYVPPTPIPQPKPQLPSGEYDSSWFTRENGTFVLNTTINLRTAPFSNAPLIATLYKGQTVNYNGFGIEKDGHVWIRQPRAGGKFGYMATGESRNGKRVDYWGTFK
ncbi:N-acetylmuramoyl-L-alanine amidase [Bacillus paranthracis]|nr:N-acetylmuramoyl-L-alanine amidase [Bacillus paranthracis]